jgi:hypothetical protein
MKAEEFYKQRSNSIRELWALSPKQIEYIALIMEEYAALRQPLVSGELNCEHDWLVDMYDHFGFPASRFCDKCNTREAI